jgi:peroxiredoxin
MFDVLQTIFSGSDSMQDKLAKVRHLRDDFIPSEFTAIMDRAIDDLVKSGVRKSALKLNDHIPQFTLLDTDGVIHSAADLLQAGPLVISFYRGSWCPYCNIELRGLQAALPKIKALGASVIGISPELPERQLETRETNELGFPILHDPGNQVAKLFGIVYELPTDLLAVYQDLGHDLAHVNGTSSATELPLPATFVVAQSGRVSLAYIDEDYARRLSTDHILAALHFSIQGDCRYQPRMES